MPYLTLPRRVRARRVLPVLALVGALAALGAGCGGSSNAARSAKKPTVPPNGVAVVGSETISKAQVDDLLGELKRSYSNQKKAFPKPSTTAYRNLRDQAVLYLVQVSELDQRAADLGVKVSPKKLDSFIAQVKQQSFGGQKQYEAAIKAQGLTDAEFRQEARLQLVQQGLYAKITSKVKVSDKDVKHYYDTHASQYEQADSRTVRHILVKTKALADKLYGELRAANTKNFAALARKYSQDPGSAKSGGKLSITRGETVAPFDKVAFSLKTNELAKPVKSQYGWHIIQALTPVKKGGKTPLSQVSSTIRQQLETTKKSAAATSWIKETRKDFCAGKIAFKPAYAPQNDPCAPAPKAKTAGSTKSK